MKQILLAASLLAFAMSESAFALTSENACKTGYVEWQDQPLSKIVEGSHTIYLGVAQEFVPDTSRQGFEGYYLMVSTGVELKGGPVGSVKVYGHKPLDYPPQIYFDIESRHNELAANHKSHNQITIPGGIASTTNVDNHCPLAPKLVLGYSYLIMLGTDSQLSFEPIHSGRASDDAWFRLVENMVEAQRY